MVKAHAATPSIAEVAERLITARERTCSNEPTADEVRLYLQLEHEITLAKSLQQLLENGLVVVRWSEEKNDFLIDAVPKQ